jgi:hypothetical protein
MCGEEVSNPLAVPHRFWVMPGVRSKKECFPWVREFLSKERAEVIYLGPVEIPLMLLRLTQ